MKTNGARDLAGCCGLFCGLCARYQSRVPGRCMGCKLGEGHSSCSIWNCCVRKLSLETCAQCPDPFHCQILTKRGVMDDPEWIPAPINLHQIQEIGLEDWLAEQAKRQALLEILLQNYNEGRSMAFYCKACARMPIELINKAVREANKKLVGEEEYKSDIKLKAKFLRLVMKYLALKANVNLD